MRERLNEKKSAAESQTHFSAVLRSVRAIWALATVGAKRAVSPRRAILLGVLMLVPIAIAVISQRLEELGERDAPAFVYGVVAVYYVSILIPLSAIGTCTGLLRDDIDDKTLTYLLTRPISRAGLYGGKVLGALIVLVGATCASALAFNVVVWLPLGMLHSQMRVLLASMAATSAACVPYACLFSVIGLVVPRPSAVSAIYVFGYEAVAVAVGTRLVRYTLAFYPKSLFYQWVGRPDELKELLRRVQAASGPEAMATIVIVSLIFVAIGAAIVTLREFRISEAA